MCEPSVQQVPLPGLEEFVSADALGCDACLEDFYRQSGSEFEDNGLDLLEELELARLGKLLGQIDHILHGGDLSVAVLSRFSLEFGGILADLSLEVSVARGRAAAAERYSNRLRSKARKDVTHGK